MSLKDTIMLSSDRPMPILGLGVWKMEEGKETEDAVRAALEAGYRHIDTAKLYGNEKSVGKAIRESNLPREEIFVTTKLWPTNFFNPEAGFEDSFDRLGLEYIDLYLIHWPAPIMPKKIWQTLEKIHADGRARSIGVSNYGIRDIEKLASYATVMPAVNQVEFNPSSHDLELLQYCISKNIVVEAYSPLGRGGLIENRTVKTIAESHKKTPAQILIRWALQHQTIPLPKSSNPARIQENAEVFDFVLTNTEVETLDRLND